MGLNFSEANFAVAGTDLCKYFAQRCHLKLLHLPMAIHLSVHPWTGPDPSIRPSFGKGEHIDAFGKGGPKDDVCMWCAHVLLHLELSVRPPIWAGPDWMGFMCCALHMWCAHDLLLFFVQHPLFLLPITVVAL